MHKLTESILDKFSMDYLRNQVLKNAYGNDDTVIAGLDPRVLLVWYLFFGLVPWFLNDLVILLGLFIFVALTTRAAKIAPLVLFLFCLGVFSQTGYLLIAALFFGGDASTVAPPPCDDAESGGGLPGLHHGIFRTGSGQAGKWDVVVWMPGSAVLFHLFCLSDPTGADGRISEYPAVLPAARESAGKEDISWQDPLSVLPDQADHPGLLSSDAEYGQEIPDYGGSAGDKGISVCIEESDGEKDEACHAEGDEK